jgi:transcriptional regulator with XRE-family HTH domain
MPKPSAPAPVAIRAALKQLGADVSEARRRRRLTMEVVANRALTTRQTVARIERGDPVVAMGTWASVLFALQLANRLGDLAAPASDREGLAIEAERLPKRVRMPKAL